MELPERQSQALAAALSEALSAAGVSQRDAALRSGIPLVTLSRRLTGKSPLRADELTALAVLAGTSVSALAASVEQRLGVATDSHPGSAVPSKAPA